MLSTVTHHVRDGSTATHSFHFASVDNVDVTVDVHSNYACLSFEHAGDKFVDVYVNHEQFAELLKRIGVV